MRHDDSVQQLLISVLLLAAAVPTLAGGLPPATDWKEVVEPGEAKIFADFAAEINRIQDNTAAHDQLPIARGFHIKTHKVMTAEFRVVEGIPEQFRIGVFREPATYKAWVRFSNLKPQRLADRNPDFRAMAVKLLDVAGTPLTPGVNSLDLMGLNHPLQPARNIHQFIAFVRYSFHLLTFPIKLAAAIGPVEAARMITWMARNLGERIMSLATLEYWSTLPMAYGRYAVKYKFEPHNGPAGRPDVNVETYLRDELVARLKRGPLRWDFLVQFYTDPRTTPIEDAVVVWSPEKSPFLKVGELTIAARDLNSSACRAEEAKGDKLLWNSWHGPTEHRPLGGLQRARRVAYPQSGKHRGSIQP